MAEGLYLLIPVMLKYVPAKADIVQSSDLGITKAFTLYLLKILVPPILIKDFVEGICN